ncbi:MAG TPA: zinc ribbon domain-containing protein [Polyangia bacterium]|nr:zinc ribbon domain-containing protein [Polyangia bacterium]
MYCPRCGSPASGAQCARCGESLAFAPPQAAVDADSVALAAVASAEGIGFLIAAGALQIIGGALWVLVGVIAAAVPRLFRDRLTDTPGVDPHTLTLILVGAFVVMTLGGVMTIVVSIFVILRHRWAWIVSLIFDGLWILLGLATMVQSPPAGVMYIAMAGGLVAFLMAGRRALRS